MSSSIKAGSFRAGFYIICCCSTSLFGSDAVAEKRLHIGVDPRIELLTTIQLLSQYRYLTPYRIDYARDIIAHFSNHQRHQAVTLFRNLSKGQGWSDQYPTAMLYLSAPPELEISGPIPPHIYRAFSGPENFLRFVQALRDFARQTSFNRFYAGQEKLYLRLGYGLRENMTEVDAIGSIEAYFGSRQASYHLVLSPLLHHGGFGPHIGRPGGPYDVYTLIGPTGALRGMPQYEPRDHLLQIVWHEFSHAFINPLSEKFYPELMGNAGLYAPISEQMARLGYTHWLDCANEHLIRAVAARLVHHHVSPEAGRQALREESGRGFRYIHAIARRLAEYEDRRNDYPTFASFFPRLIGVFSELSD